MSSQFFIFLKNTFILFFLILILFLSSCDSGTLPAADPTALPTVFDRAQYISSLPTVISLQLYSSNLCNPSFAVDNDLITCEFTLANPCYLLEDFDMPVGYLFHMQPDLRHWSFVFRIQNGCLPDQAKITADALLNQLFNGNYRYFGNCNDITYFAPIEISYQASESTFEIHGNHSLLFLPPEQITIENKDFWSVSVIDAAGNGPCCITVPLESPDTLLYNLTNLDPYTYRIDLYSPDRLSFISQKEEINA